MGERTNLTVSVDEDLKRRAKIRAIEKGTSLSEVVRKALEEFVKDCESEDDTTEGE